MMGYTPGPWGIAFEHGKSIVIGTLSRGVAVIPNDRGEGEPERLANARLIAVAPEMHKVIKELMALAYEAMSRVNEDEKGYYDIEYRLEKAEAIVEKVGGK